MSVRTVAPGLLIAMPQLGDPNFERSVVLMVEHESEGSLGLVINRPSDTPLAEVLSSLEMEWKGDPLAVVWSGGPVQPLSGWLLHPPLPVVDSSGVIHVSEQLMLSTSPDQLRAVVGNPPDQLRFLLGYAGWGGLQLESELASGAWLLAEATPELVFGTAPEELWETAIRSLGIDPANLVPGSGVH